MPSVLPEERERAAGETLTAPLGLAWPRPRPTAKLRLAALLAALAGHLGVLHWVTQEPPDPMAGGHGRVLDAVNVTMVDSTAFEARPDVSAPPAPAAVAAVEAKEGTVETKAAPQQAERKEEKREPERHPEMPVPPEVVEAPSVVKPLQEERERKEASTAAHKGGAAARGDAPSTEKQAAPAAASPGAVREYERYVIQALVKAKPKSGLCCGTVKVKFRISPDGEISFVEISKSSRNKRLDDEGVATVRRARFPRPPSGMTDEQRFYELPVNFVR
jgi:TonB family protein